jgi:hypothetical protein
MKSYIYILVCLIAFLPFNHAQEGQLVLTNKKTHVERAIQPGKTIRVKSLKNLRLRGVLTFIDSETISLGKDSIPLSDILRIDARTVDSRSPGIVLIALGAGVFALGVPFSQEISLEGGVALCILGGGMMAGGIKKLTVGQAYISRKWSYNIR